MPSEMPTDGVVLLSDLYTVPTGLGITLGSIRDYNKTSINLTRESDSALLNYISVGNMTLSRYTEIVSYDPSYELLMSCDTRPVLLAKNDGTSKVIIAPFSLHYANVAIRKDFPTLLFNIFEYFFQPTIAENTFEVYESVSVNSMGQNVIVDSDSGKITLTEFPATLKLDLPGAYTLTQTTDFGKVLEDRIYVKIPASESNIFDTEDTFRNPFLVESDTNYFRQLMVYFAAALVALLFVEWFLQARDNM
jgi:hypothetical protein